MASVLSVVILLLLAAGLWWLAMRRLDCMAGADWGRRWINRLDRIIRLFCRRFHRLNGDHLPLPESGPALLIANHCSGLDPLLLVASSNRPLRFIIASEYYHLFGLHWLFSAVGGIPVERAARPERAFRAAIKALRAGEVVALFPHGAIHVDSEPYRPLKPGVARLAQLAQIPVYVARIDGVRGQGRVLSALVMPSRARITGFAPVPCHTMDEKDCLARLESHIKPGERPAA